MKTRSKIHKIKNLYINGNCTIKINIELYSIWNNFIFKIFKFCYDNRIPDFYYPAI